jgi:hypothetical protein
MPLEATDLDELRALRALDWLAAHVFVFVHV